MTDRIGQGPFFQRGIESVTVKNADVSTSLPDSNERVAVVTLRQSMLDGLLSARSLENYLDTLALPEIEDRELMLPHVFAEVLKNVREQVCAERPDLDPKSPDARALRRACRVLSEETELRQLAHMYFSALYQG